MFPPLRFKFPANNDTIFNNVATDVGPPLTNSPSSFSPAIGVAARGIGVCGPGAPGFLPQLRRKGRVCFHEGGAAARWVGFDAARLTGSAEKYETKRFQI